MEKEPMCCGVKMETGMELGRFTELVCPKCHDTVYVKKTSVFW